VAEIFVEDEPPPSSHSSARRYDAGSRSRKDD
jgi:hypothetical protein